MQRKHCKQAWGIHKAGAEWQDWPLALLCLALAWVSAFSSLADLSLAAQPVPVAKESGDTKVEELAGLHRETLRPVSR